MATSALLPLGALLLAGSLNAAAQSSAPVPAAPESVAQVLEELKSLKPVTINATRDRNLQTYQSGLTTIGKTPNGGQGHTAIPDRGHREIAA